MMVSALLIALGGQASSGAVFSEIAAADTLNRQNQATTNFGSTTVIDTGAGFWNSFLRWDLPGDLGGMTVVSATLTVPVRSGPAAAAGDYALQAFNQEWVEGEATFEYAKMPYDASNQWGGAGGSTTNGSSSARVRDTGGSIINFDVQAVPEAAYVSETVPATTVVFDATSIVQFWADGNLNAGLSIQAVGGQSSTSAAFNFGSRENAAAAMIPVLAFEYVPEPATIGLLGLGGLVLLGRRRK